MKRPAGDCPTFRLRGDRVRITFPKGTGQVEAVQILKQVTTRIARDGLKRGAA
jgi:hypothetical protein